MNKVEFKHILITRLNVFYKTKMAERGFDPEFWLLERVELFKRFCFPSILIQSNKNFTWFFYIDSETPSLVRADLEALFVPFPFIQLISHQFENFSIAKYLQSDIDRFLGTEFHYLISSRVDTDDMLHRDYVTTVQSKFANQDYTALNFNNGLVYHVPTGVSSTMIHRYNAFLSLIEKRSKQGFRTVYHKQHTDYRFDNKKVEILIKRPMWCVTIHGLNDSTSFYGKVHVIDQPDFSRFFGLNHQKKPSIIDISRFLQRSYIRTLRKVKFKLESFIK